MAARDARARLSCTGSCQYPLPNALFDCELRELVHLAWPVFVLPAHLPCPISTASSKAGGYVGSELPHKAAVIPGAAELSVARVYIRCAPAHSDISVGTHISVGLHLGKLPGTTPCYSPHKSVGTRSGVVPGAPVGVLASWDIGAPRSDRQAVPEKEGQIFSVEKCWPGCQFQYCHRKGTSAFQHLRF